MRVELNFILPHRNDLTAAKNPHFTDWMIQHHHEILFFDWPAIPNIGDAVSVLTENETQVYGIVKEREWNSDLSSKENNDFVYLIVEVTNADQLDAPLY